MSFSTDADLVIVGGGPAGLSTALFFEHAAPRLRERVLVLERGRYPREKVCAGAIGARADRLLASIGVRVDVPSVPMFGLSVSTRGGKLVRRRDTGPPIGRVVRRVEFDHALAEQARAAGLRVFDGVSVSSISIDAKNGVSLETSAGRVRAAAIVGADGVGSIVRRSLGLPKGAFLAKALEIDTERVATDAPADLLSFDLSACGLAGYAWDFPTLVAGRSMVCRGIYELSAEGVPARAPDQEEPGARLVSRASRLGLSVEASKLKRFAERGLSLNEPFAAPRVLLVGEAAGIDPALGEGIAQAIHYGALAGPFLAAALQKGDLSFASFPEVLRKSRLGLDLLLRGRAARYVYGRTRPLVESWVTSSSALAGAGMSYFAGERVARLGLVRAGFDLGRAYIAQKVTSLRSAASP